ncbi:aldehyde dehydrogenase family protein [Sphingomonas immobilis]|uniref:Aldehyde dehydrogenase family protein n=1 Tax=Sphingomonas immobilis TaxID=3063997 RepID=A0ABT8ZXY1_9SPHN|nr:aldehyde dehydrogenase family protein [Sphingomonas sp. CA1-15]MDO7842133.1 aldehyde dehydrogenase family protein [Sphingomonas sp. CA1-15]
MAVTEIDRTDTTGSAAAALMPAAGWPHKMLIGGRAVAGEGAPIAVEHPGDGAVFTQFAGASDGQIEAAIATARAAADTGEWAALKPVERVAIVRRFVAALRSRADELEKVVIAEGGCPISSVVLPVQVRGPLATVEDQLDLYLTLPESESNPLPLEERINAAGTVFQSMRRYVPHGVVVAISAYNFPFFLNIWKLVPALATGNCVILRPSPLTPLSALAMVAAAQEAGFPDGVLNIVAEAGADGALALTTDPRVDMVSFTGSTDVGKKVMAQGAATMKRLQLELGGKSAQIFMADRLAAAAGAAAGVCLAHAGQGCVLGTRVLVPESEKAAVMAAMAKAIEGLVPGDPLDPATRMGPVINAAQRARCERYVELAVAAGATVVAGGKAIDTPGHYFEPTILDVPDASNPAARDEIFGPIVAVIGYRDIDHAVEIANDSIFGLSGYVYGADARAALAVAKRIRSGTVNVNIGGAMSGYASSGGHGSSGLGRERGVEGLRVYQELQCLNFAS